MPLTLAIKALENCFSGVHLLEGPLLSPHLLDFEQLQLRTDSVATHQANRPLVSANKTDEPG